MIGYRIARADLEVKIEAEVPGWIADAAKRTARFRAAKSYAETSSTWSKVKVVYMRLQGGSKCAYCERKLESEQIGRIEQDVEHFRPKANVSAWTHPDLTAEGVRVTTPPAAGAKGYYLLPYDVFNYGASCKPCNSVLKKDRFPVAGRYRFTGASPESLRTEKPLLIYPIGDFDDDPEDLIEFYGASPRPKQARGHGRDRALTTIEFFLLDDVDKRKNLFRDRAIIIIALYGLLVNLSRPGGPTQRDQALVAGFTSSKAAHANCARSFRRLYRRDAAEAKNVADAAAAFFISIS